jgi:hypothetical protein
MTERREQILAKSSLQEGAQTMVVSDYFYHYEKLILSFGITRTRSRKNLLKQHHA